MDLRNLNMFGALTACVILVLCILIFIFRMINLPRVESWLGLIFIGCSLPVVLLLVKAPENNQPVIYYIQLGLMLLFIVIELLLDYIFKYDFRSIQWMTIAYLTMFFASTGGMIGVASNAGKVWIIITVVLFFIMVALSFVQHSKTGM